MKWALRKETNPVSGPGGVPHYHTILQTAPPVNEPSGGVGRLAHTHLRPFIPARDQQLSLFPPQPPSEHSLQDPAPQCLSERPP